LDSTCVRRSCAYLGLPIATCTHYSRGSYSNVKTRHWQMPDDVTLNRSSALQAAATRTFLQIVVGVDGFSDLRVWLAWWYGFHIVIIDSVEIRVVALGL
jgi:hypothetical protein